MACAVVFVALLIAIVTLIPAELWSHPATDQHYKGFDPNLVYANDEGVGSIAVNPGAVDIFARPSPNPGLYPAVTLITTPLQHVAVSLKATVVQDQGAVEPLRIGLWSPLNFPQTGSVGYFVVFGPAPGHTIAVERVIHGTAGTTLIGGSLQAPPTLVGSYAIGRTYQIAVNVDRQKRLISYQVFSDGGLIGQDAVSSRDFPELFAPVRLVLTAASIGLSGTAESILSDYSVTMLHERFWTSKVDDVKAEFLLLALAVAALVMVTATLINRRRGIAEATRKSRTSLPGWSGFVGRHRFTVLAVAAAVAAYLAGNAFLFRFAGHPFDMGGAKVFAYVAQAFGPIHLYYLPNITPLAVWKGIPYEEAGDPYGPVSSYLFMGIGWLDRTLFGPITLNDGLQLETLIKSVNVLFGLGDAVLIYLILGRTGVAQRWRFGGSALFLFNPAVWFSMSVWGQTHVISVFFVLLAVLLAESGMVTWSWLALIASCLTRPQMLVFALLIGIVLLRKFDWRSNLFGLSWAIVLTFLFVLPLSIVSSPSLPVDLIINNFYIQEAGGNDPAVTTVSQGAYSIWPLITPVTGAYSGLRLSIPSLNPLIGPLSYQRASQILTAVAMLLVIAWLIRLKRESLAGGAYLPLVAIGTTAFLMLLTGILPTHFLLALPFLLLCRRWLDNTAYIFVAGIWTITTLVPMFGEMGLLLTNANLLLAPAYKPITDLAIKIFLSDRFMTAGVTANICVMVWLVYVTLRGISARQMQSKAAA